MAKKTSGRKYSRKASTKVEKAMHERKRGTLKSGSTGKRVTSRKQAIAIGLSEAREEGAKVPAPKKATAKSAKKTRAKKTSKAAKTSKAKSTRKKTARKKTTRKASR